MPKLNRRSHLITAGVTRSPNRAMLRVLGFKDGDFEKPIVGVANGHSTMNPCNAGIQPLVDRAVAALTEAGAMPQTFGFPTVNDGIGIVGSNSSMSAPRLSEPARSHRSNSRQLAAPNSSVCPHALSNIFLPSWAKPGTVTSACVKSSGWRRCISAM